jgi:branched-chain amino acid transport system ATP-binding protein
VTTPAIEVKNLSLRFGNVAALTDVSFDVHPGELFAVIGPNGAGKSSLFNVLTRLYDRTSGHVQIHGEDITPLKPRDLARRGLARSFQNLGLFPQRTVLENVLIGRHHLMSIGPIGSCFGLPGARSEEDRHRRASMDVLSSLDLAGVANRTVGALSYGLQKRVELARCIAAESRLLLLDEPVAGMSASERSGITEVIEHVHRERDLTILLVEHDVGMVMKVADRVMVLDFGHVVTTGTPDHVQQSPAVVRAYLGEPIEDPK